MYKQRDGQQMRHAPSLAPPLSAWVAPESLWRSGRGVTETAFICLSHLAHIHAFSFLKKQMQAKQIIHSIIYSAFVELAKKARNSI